MSQLTCHNHACDCDIGTKTISGNVTSHMSQHLSRCEKAPKKQFLGGGPTTHIQVVWQGPKSFKIFLLFKQNPFFHFLKLLIFVVFGCWRSDKWCYQRQQKSDHNENNDDDTNDKCIRIYRLSGKVPNPLKYFCRFKQNPFFHFLKLLIFVVFGCWRSDKWCY